MQTISTTKVALVDDHKLFRKGIMELINGFSGYSVTLEAENGKDFIRKLFPENIPSIVLLDISMPVMDGFETAKWLQENHPDVKILALSMSNDEETVLRMLKCGVDGYILKNADPSELRMALDALETNGSYYSNSISDILKRDLKGNKQGIVHLTDREIEFLKLACTELPYKSFAPIMNVSKRVVESTREILFKKLEVVSRIGLVTYAIKYGIVKLD
ncbi:LuxR family two component transcriptional regulator [Pontibacter ummariensis]|uniref:Two component transcriptional regulator, LuxR family n=1 Tax=Pontibacter ummariensis TaxID=1610492 RepID=A0A239IGW1_9BACT|nr:response regulator transcription factor [Pontibacter ummariensis]PRY09837.1 LuxR family two component transcriptional regulator [Pontibacter ummariensis]SNS92662.1 two component transcriptional regulator, LuxR family [Pontibacter ummariensis]